jgi:hypothetical protein
LTHCAAWPSYVNLPAHAIGFHQQPVPTYFVEKLRLIRALVADSLLPVSGEIRPMMGERRVMQEALF